MRVLYCIETFLPHIGGAQVLASKFIPAMQARGHQFVVVTSMSTLDSTPQSTINGISVFRFPFHKVLAERSLKEVRKVQERYNNFFRDFQPDIVHINSISPDVFFYLHSISTHPVPILLTLHGGTFASYSRDNTLVMKTFHSASWIVAVSKALLLQTRQIYPEIVSRSSFILNGLDMPLDIPTPLNLDSPTLLCLGRLFPQKGFDLAISAISLLVKRFPKIKLIIAGDGPSRQDLWKQAEKMGLESTVDFIGWVPPEKVIDLINHSSIVVMPSRWEGLPLVALQTAQMGRPIIATKIAGLREVVRNQKTGLLVESENYQELAKAIIYLIENPEEAIRMGKSAKKWVQKAFNFERHLDEYEKLYQNLANSTHD